VSQWLRCGFGLINRFIGFPLAVTTIISYTVKITVTLAHVKWHTKYSNSSSGHTVLPLELRNSSEVNSHSSILSCPLGTDHAQKTKFYYCVAQTTQKTSHVINISPVHWRADYCLATSYKYSSYCCVPTSWGIFPAVALQCVDMSNIFFYFSSYKIYLAICFSRRDHQLALNINLNMLCNNVTETALRVTTPITFTGV
jgi:hypothetical protein